MFCVFGVMLLGPHEMYLGFSWFFFNAGGLEPGKAGIMHGGLFGSVEGNAELDMSVKTSIEKKFSSSV